MLRAQYDSNGNIILGSIPLHVPARTPARIVKPETKQSHPWTVLTETDENVPQKKPSPEKYVPLQRLAAQTGSMVRASLAEGERQFQSTVLEAEHGAQEVRQALTELPKRASHWMQSLWHVAMMPVTVPRKPGKRPRRKATLFLIDTIRFGGTFGVIFAVLFVGINYQSFWQIARAELALDSDITTEQALTDITKGSAAIKALQTLQHSGSSRHILAYLPAVGPHEDRLIIPKLGENVPIVRPGMDALMKEDWKQFENDIQTALKGGVVHYPGSARPGQAGNFFLTGHSSFYPWDDGKYKDVFARLHELEPGDTYSVYYGGDRHTYRIVKKFEVKPNNVSVLDQPSTSRLSTLMTCTPVGTTLRRLIVQAEEIDPASGETLNVGEKIADTPESPFSRLEALPI